jgi:hypothetical protein
MNPVSHPHFALQTGTLDLFMKQWISQEFFPNMHSTSQIGRELRTGSLCEFNNVGTLAE